MLRSLVLLTSLITVVVGFAEDAPAPAAAKDKKATVLYCCAKCTKCALAAGKCATCEQDLAANHVLAIKDGNALCCACAADCANCKLSDDGTKCGCGKDVAKCPLAGKFVCEKDLTIADKAGKCAVCDAGLTEVKPAWKAGLQMKRMPQKLEKTEKPKAE